MTFQSFIATILFSVNLFAMLVTEHIVIVYGGSETRKCISDMEMYLCFFLYHNQSQDGTW